MGLNLRRFSLVAALALLLLSACGGGGALEGENDASGTPTKGLVVDGYLSIAKVVCDTNHNGVADAGEPVTYTNTQGNFVFRAGCAHGVLASGGTNLDTGAAFLGQLSAPAGATVVTPLTTLVAAGMTQDEVIKALNLPPDTQLLTTDPAATQGTSLANADLYKKTLAVQQILQKTTNVFTQLTSTVDYASSATVYGESAKAMATQLKTQAPLIDAHGQVSSAVVQGLVAAAVDKVMVSSLVAQGVKKAISEAGGTATLPTLVNVAFANQAQRFVDAQSADLPALIPTLQRDPVIEINVQTAFKAGALGALGSNPSPNAMAAIKENIALNTQLPLVLEVGQNSLLTSGQTTLSTRGGSGTGTVGFSISSGACTLSGSTLTAPPSPDTCTVTASKAADTSYAPATSQSVTVTVTATLTSTSPVDFEAAGRGASFAWSTFENDTNPAAQSVANPDKSGINTSNTVLKFTALKAGKPYAGLQSAHGVDLGTVTFSASNALVKMMVYKTVISDVGVKFESAGGQSSGEIKTANTTANAWESLSFDFCGRLGEANDRLILFPDFNMAGRSANTTSYLDNISFNACPPPSASSEPTTAPDVPTAPTADVISLYGDGYPTASGTDTPRWGGAQTTVVSAQTYVGNNVLKLASLNYQGLTNTATLDVSSHTYLHLDFWSQEATTIEVKLVSRASGVKEQSIFIPVSAGSWNSKDIALSNFTVPDKTIFEQLILATANAGKTLFIDNIYFWK